jgi:hypothetical protein
LLNPDILKIGVQVGQQRQVQPWAQHGCNRGSNRAWVAFPRHASGCTNLCPRMWNADQLTSYPYLNCVCLPGPCGRLAAV